jgi:anti-sigma B factor antagonist
MILTIERKQVPPDVTVLELTGRIVLGNDSREVELRVAEILRENGKKIVIDLKGTTMLDSTGVGILVVCQGKVAKEGGQLRVSGATGIVEDILKTTNVGKLVSLFPTLADAIDGF